ncbi:putative gustatory receptor 28a [Lutzomyia longipalpis]|uniref:putative gustatory receptor 28a n=1 Tax=Lutzomyia longipalpis TaxID=7200 RepID=UPI00248448D4|nr:putative gustatory receptor 28a [Lutzomyia longipalpis]
MTTYEILLEVELKKYLIEGIFINLVALFVEITIISRLDTTSGFFEHRLAVLIPFNGNRMAIFHFLLYIHITRSYLHILAMQLQRIHRKIELFPQPPTKHGDALHGEIKALKVIHRNLWEICCNINKSFNWTLLCIIIMYFLIIIVDLYWCFLKILVGSSNHITESFLCPIPVVLSFIPLVYTADSLLNAPRIIQRNLHELQMEAQNRTLHQFALQIHILHVEFTPKGIFLLDFKLFTAFVTTMGMYLIILIQFEYDRSQITTTFK